MVLARVGAIDADHYLYELPAPDFRSAAGSRFLELTVRYGLVLGFGVLLGLWRGRTSAASYGLSRPSRGLVPLVGTGILLGLLASLPEQALRLLNNYVPLGPGTRFWNLEARVPWNADFWLYMAVGSYFVVPVFEEVFTRGYLLGRIRESFSPGVALLIMALFFSFSHGQYRHADVLAAGTLVSLLVWSLILGYSVYRTGSLVPAVIAHGMGNVPMTVEVRWTVLGVSLLALAIWREAFLSWVAGVIRTLREVDDWAAAALVVVALVVVAATLRVTPWMPYAWFGVLGILTALGIRHRSAWAEQAPS